MKCYVPNTMYIKYSKEGQTEREGHIGQRKRDRERERERKTERERE